MKLVHLPLTTLVMSSFRFDKNRILNDIAYMFSNTRKIDPSWIGVREVCLPPANRSDGECSQALVVITSRGTINDHTYEIDNMGNLYIGKSPHPLTTNNGHQLSWDSLVKLWGRAVWRYAWRDNFNKRPYKNRLVKLDQDPSHPQS